MEDLHFSQGYLTVLGKESKQRMVPFYPRCGQLLQHYVQYDRPLLMSKVSEHVVQELLGHENLSTTQIYTHVDEAHLRNAVEMAHPYAVKKVKK